MHRRIFILIFVSLFSFSTSLSAQIGFEITSQQATIGDTLSLDIKTTGFNEVIGFQYGIKWNPEYFEYLSAGNFNLPNFSDQTFGVPGEGNNVPGNLRISWVDALFSGINVPDGTVVFSIQFLVKTGAQTSTFIEFSEDVLAFEAIDLNSNSLSPVPMINSSIFLNGTPSFELAPALSLDTLQQPGCSESNGTLGFSALGGTPPYRYQWSGPAGFTSTAASISGLQAGTYNVTATDSEGRTLTAYSILNTVGSYTNLRIDTDCKQDFRGWLEVTGRLTSLINRDYDYIWSNGFKESNFELRSTTLVPVNEISYLTTIDNSGCSFTTEAIFPPQLCEDLLIDTVVLIAPDQRLRFLGDTVILPVLANNMDRLTLISFSMEWDSLDMDLIGYTINDQFNEPSIDVQPNNLLFTAKQAEAFGFPDSLEILNLVFKTKNVSPSSINFSKSRRGEHRNNNFVHFETNDAAISFGLWPGDTDKNGKVDIFDIFNIGSGFGRTGPPRVDTTTNWQAAVSDLWPSSTPNSQVNYRFADTDGNGRIEQQDVSVIEQNYGQSHLGKTLPADLIEARNQRNIPFSISIDSLITGNDTSLPISLGTAEDPISDVYSIGFSIAYDAVFFEEASLQLNLSNSWLAENSDDLISIVKAVPTENRIDVAISRIDGQNINGSGELLRLDLKVLDQIPFAGNEQQVALELSGIRVQDINENTLAVNPSNKVLEVMTSSRLKTLPASWFSVFPVPASQSIFLRTTHDVKVEFLHLMDNQGRILDKIDYSSQDLQQSIDISSYANGTYLMQIYTKEGFLTKKLLIQRD